MFAFTGVMSLGLISSLVSTLVFGLISVDMLSFPYITTFVRGGYVRTLASLQRTSV